MGFPNQIFCDSWVVGFLEGRPWWARGRIGKTSLGWLKPFLDRLGHARDKGVTAGRRMRIDTTVVETDIHHPTDGTMLRDGVRVLTHIMR
jgi:hypothetical protein